MLPLPFPIFKQYELCGVNLAFDPLKSSYYKIISVWQQRRYLILEEMGMEMEMGMKMERKAEYFIDIYSSQNCHWSYRKINFSWEEGMKFYQGVFLRVHRQGYRWFGECGGYLNLVVALVPSLLEYSVFEMAEDHSHWHLKYSLNLEADPYRILKMKRMVFKLLCVTHSEEEGDSMFIVDEDGTGISYNFKNNTRKDVRCTFLTISSSSIQEYSLRCSLYFETLCCM
ncbi:hypothetical protein E1A91_A11G251700v1 [Gossypium mustelinum]|uniref:Uncharacterized protein n=1 Tax=Gossypium mustelinum TaxID=34275 RepID=A0A5D2XAS0_GOSMU|nr:hypothetical protein E1A91_A11G251700v1 [Gossypium mustelinum]